MASEKQIAANRRNGKKSTGPRTPAGKARVARNALKHGLLAQAALLPGEDTAAFEAFAASLVEELRPCGAVESLLADEIVNLAWRLQRASRVEAGLFVYEQAVVDDQWVREQRTKQDEQAKLEGKLQQARNIFGAEFDQLLKDAKDSKEDWSDAEGWDDEETAIDRCDAAAAAARWSELGRLAAAFTHSVRQPDPFSKLNRYEASIARRLTRTRHELATLQEAREPADRDS